MEFLSAIATAIVGKIAEYTVGPVVRQISYVTGYKGNLQQLDAAVEKLKAAKESVANEVGVAERRGERIQPAVQLWLKKVDDITAKTDQFFQEERPAELKCFHGGFCGNLKIRRQISRKSTKLLPEVVEVLDEKRGFSTVACGVRRQEVWGVSTGEYQAFASRTLTVKEIMDELKNPNIKRIGVYGIGGVGKTTLVQQVYKQATEVEKKLFDDVVLVLDVKENPDPEGIQKKIVEKLGMKISESEDETKYGRANRLCGRIKDKKTLVILDDVWEEIKLEALGIPSVATCKILLTSRSRKALTDMNADKDFELCLLEHEDTWVLFENKAGDVVKDPAIRTIAIQIAEYCRGLPVLVVTVASTLKRRISLPPWEDALRRLKESDSPDLTEKAYSGLEWSYSKLNRGELQQFFLLCGITIRGNKIILTDLLRYGIGLGFLGKLSKLKDARNKVLSLVEELKDFCLLIEGDNSEYVRMHDLVRDVANRIALRDHILSSVVDGSGRELKEWSDEDFLEKCTIISLPCGNNISRLPTVLQCQALRMLLLQGDRDDDSLTILPTFFEEMKQLKVLALEKMCIPSLPSSFQSLKNVQTLCLEECNLGDITLVGELSNLEILSFANSKLEQLPKEIAELNHLRLLDLTNCYKLQVISYGVISSLKSLEDLRMNNFRKWEAEGEGSNACPSELMNLSRLTSLHIVIPDVNILPADLFSCFKLETYQIDIGYGYWVTDFEHDETVNTLKIAKSIQLEGLKMLLKKSHQLYLAGTCGAKNTLDHQLDTEDFQQLKRLVLGDNFDFTYIINRTVVFPNLTTLRVDECHGLRFLFSSLMARSLKELKKLKVESCKIMEEIVSSTTGEDGEENVDNLFPKLQSLTLYSLPKLVRFCTSSYIEFSSLEELELIECCELESFICDSLNSGEQDREEITLQYSLSNEKVVFPSLTTLRVDKCHGLRYLFSSSMARSLKELKNLKVGSCDIMEEIVLSTRREDGEENMVNLFPKLQSLRLNSLPKLLRFCTSSCIEFSLLKELEIGSCDELESFICDSLNSGEKDQEETTLQYSFFNAKVVFPSLTALRLNGCHGLRFLFSSSMARSLKELKKLEVESCKIMEEIVLSTRREDGEENMVNLFPKLQSLRLNSLPKLVRFCTSSYIEFSSLEELELSYCDELESFICDSLNSGEKDREETALQCSLSNEKVVFPSLTALRLNGCHGLRFLFSSSMARSLKELKNLKVGSCDIMEEIVLSTRREDGEENMVNLFPKLQSLRLNSLPKLLRFCTSSCIEFSLLEELEIGSCDELESFICDSLNSGEKDREETALQYSFFNAKVGCRNLENLIIHGSSKLKTIWQNQLVADQDSFYKLREVNVTHCRSLINMFSPSIMVRLNALKTIRITMCESLKVVFEVMRGPVDDDKAEIAHVDTSSSKPLYCPNLDSVHILCCGSLQHIFPVAVARGLEQLHKLRVWQCEKLEGIIGEEAEGVIENSPHELVFPNVSSLDFTSLPQLKSFYTIGMHTSKWPSLKQLTFDVNVHCKVFASEVSLFREKHDQMDPESTNRPFFLILKDSFPELEELTLGKLKSPAEIWYGDGPSPADFFPKLKSVCFSKWAPFSNQAALLFLDKLQNLEKILVEEDHSDEIFVGDGSGEIYALPRVRFLTLRWLYNLLHLGKSQSGAAAASPVPNLQVLELNNCDGLNSLDQSSAIPFRNLTTLKVTWCDGLKYLISYSVAKTLVQLKTMQVESCDNIEVIIATDGDDDAAGNPENVYFNCTWQHLKLRSLPSLQGFSSGNCIVKFPSLETFNVSYDIHLKIDGEQVVQISRYGWVEH